MLVSDRSVSSMAVSATAALFVFVAALILPCEPRAEPVATSQQNAFTGNIIHASPRRSLDLPTLRAPIEAGDHISTLQAIEIALTQAGDGATYVWHRGNGRITGAVRPTSTFRDADRRICRHLEMQLRLGAYVRRTEGIACRSGDGVWELEG
jgi:surface antigen